MTKECAECGSVMRVIKRDGPDECAKCGGPMVEDDQSTLGGGE